MPTGYLSPAYYYPTPTVSSHNSRGYPRKKRYLTREPLIKFIKQIMARRKETRKWSLHEVKEHFEFLFNTVSAASGA
jgi:16S rRNA A1518/A1519 N6-dimethyltransferase RsmA/KsgA/DIM1 with predicted DNA glycosylase/AP lyase activity